MAKKEVTPAPWSLSQEDLDSITAQEVIQGTDRLLPPIKDIPEEFWIGNAYTRIAEALYIGEEPEEVQIEWIPGYNGPEAITNMCRSHIRSFGLEYAHKIAGIGYMISKLIKITPIS